MSKNYKVLKVRESATFVLALGLVGCQTTRGTNSSVEQSDCNIFCEITDRLESNDDLITLFFFFIASICIYTIKKHIDLRYKKKELLMTQKLIEKGKITFLNEDYRE